MVNWSDPAVVQKCAVIFGNLVHFSAGAYTLDVGVQFLQYDWDIFTKRRVWKHTMGLYFFCKWIMFGGIIGMLVALNVNSPINCQGLYTFNQFAGNASIGTASTLLMLRTVAIWNKKIYIVIPLVLLSLGHWGILFHGMSTVRATYLPDLKTCVVLDTGTDNNNLFLNLLYLYTMFIDLVVLVVSTIGLLLTPGRSSLWKLLFKDGIVFFLVAFFCNAFVVVVLLLNLNAAMNLMFSVPAACLTASAAARSFIRLSTWTSGDVYVHHTTSVNGRPSGGNGRGPQSPADRHVATHMSTINWSRTKRDSLNDAEIGYTPDDSSSQNDTKERMARTVAFERTNNTPGVMITMDTFTRPETNVQTSKPTHAKGALSTASSLEFESCSPVKAVFPDTASTHTYGRGVPYAGANF